MLTQPTVERLAALKLNALAKAWQAQQADASMAELPFDERLAMLVEAEWLERQNKRLDRTLKDAKLRIGHACLEDVDFAAERKDAPTVYLFVQAEEGGIPVGGRPLARFMKVLDGELAKTDDTAAVAVWLGDKAFDKHKEYLPRIQMSLKLEKTQYAAFDGEKLFTVERGRRIATPLLMVVALVGITDVIFAVDSIPAIFAITSDPFIVLTSNIFAILGLRAMYFLLAAMAAKFHLLSYGLAVILVFIGGKMMLIDVIKIPVLLSLGVVVAILAVTMLWSVRTAPRIGARAQ